MPNIFLWKDFNLDKIDPSWENFFQQEINKGYFFPLLTQLDQEYKNYRCWPKKENIFRLFREVSLNQVKVVILGQDPYHLPEVADGIAFSTQKEKYIPASLKNIFLEFSQDFNCPLPLRGNLVPWVKEGVFLLNTALSVKDGQALYHMNFWKDFVYSLVVYLKNYDEKLIWVFWGQKAKNIGQECGINEKYSLFSTHPSPYSAESKIKNKKGYFIGSRVFSEINLLLSKLGREPVNWLSIIN